MKQTHSHKQRFQALDSMILTGSFQLGIFYDSVNETETLSQAHLSLPEHTAQIWCSG